MNLNKETQQNLFIIKLTSFILIKYEIGIKVNIKN